MNDIALEVLGGAATFVTAFLYTKFQTNLNHKEIIQLKKEIDTIQRGDGARDTKIAVLETQNNNVIQRLDKIDLTMEKILERLNQV